VCTLKDRSYELMILFLICSCQKHHLYLFLLRVNSDLRRDAMQKSVVRWSMCIDWATASVNKSLSRSVWLLGTVDLTNSRGSSDLHIDYGFSGVLYVFFPASCLLFILVLYDFCNFILRVASSIEGCDRYFFLVKLLLLKLSKTFLIYY